MAAQAVVLIPLRHSPWPRLTSLFSAWNHPHLFSSSARALSPLGQQVTEGDEEGETDAPAVKKSRNELKREASRAVRWGMELAKFSTPQIKKVLRIASVEREVFEALMLVKRLGSDVREGKRRQFNYIGRLLRNAEPELMDALIQASKDGDNSRLLALAGPEELPVEDNDVEENTDDLEVVNDSWDAGEESGRYEEIVSRWFEGLVDKDPSISKEVYSIHNVDFDRQELRKLVRRVQSAGGILVNGRVVGNDVELTSVKKALIRFFAYTGKENIFSIKVHLTIRTSYEQKTGNVPIPIANYKILFPDQEFLILFCRFGGIKDLRGLSSFGVEVEALVVQQVSLQITINPFCLHHHLSNKRMIQW